MAWEVRGIAANIASIAEAMVIPFVTVKHIGAGPDGFASKLTGSGLISIGTDGSREMSVGALAKEPIRIYAEGRNLMTANQPIYLNGCNTPWNQWNEFGSGGSYDHDWWNEEFLRLVSLGVNATRVWVNCSCENLGVTIDPTTLEMSVSQDFWDDVDDLMALAETHKIYIMPTMMSFDHFKWNNPGQDLWVNMLGSEAGVQSMIDNYLLPFIGRYTDNKYFWCIDLCNEMDWLIEQSDKATPRGKTCTPVGGGSNLFDFNFRASDYVVGQNLLVNQVDCGTITQRVSDTRVKTDGTFGGASAAYTTGTDFQMSTDLGGCNIATVQRYLAMASAAIHRSGSVILVTTGEATIKYGSDSYDTDYWSDARLAAITSDLESKLDLHQIHWYAWAEPWYPLLGTPVEHGLSAKPAIMGEFPANHVVMNIPDLEAWVPGEGFGAGRIIEKDDNGTLRRYICTTGWTALAPIFAGDEFGPTGTGTDLVDGDLRWSSLDKNDTWTPGQYYAKYDMIIADGNNTTNIGRVYECSKAGTAGVDPNGCPKGTGAAITDGTAEWYYKREVISTALDAFVAMQEGGWCGHFVWTSNIDSVMGSFYFQNRQGGYPTAWEANHDYYPGTSCVNDGNKMYIVIGTAPHTSAASGGPTGTGADITDGNVHWRYHQTLPNPPWTDAGDSALAFSISDASLVFPDVTGEWDNSGSTVMQSKRRTLYVPGVDMQMSNTFKFSGGSVNLVDQMVGWFDESDGIFLLRTAAPSLEYLVVRVNGTDTEIPRSSWNLDKLDGSGDSQVTVDLSTKNVLIINAGWMHGGPTKVGLVVAGQVIWMHSFDTAPFPATPNLPLRWEIQSPLGVQISGVDAMGAFCGSASRIPVDGVITPASWNRDHSALALSASTSGTLASIRLKVAAVKHATFRPKKITILDSAGSGSFYNGSTTTPYYSRIKWTLYLSDAAAWVGGTWEGVSEMVEAAIAGATSGSRVILASGYFDDMAHMEAELKNMPWIGADVDGNSEVVSLEVTNLSSTQRWYWATIDWEEAT